MASFHRGLWAGFLATAACLLGASQWATWTRFDPYVKRLDPPVSAALIDRGARYPGAAKRRGLFWVSGPHGAGAAVDLRRSPELLEDAFPGYAEAAADEELWTRYFRQPCVGSSYSTALSRPDAPAKIWTSWTGNMDLFSRYGADAVLFGNSEINADLPPVFLREELGRAAPAWRGRKVLGLSSGGLTLETVGLMLDQLARGGRKADLAVWGYSFADARGRGESAVAAAQRDDIESWRDKNNWLAAKAASVVRLLSWRKAAGMSWREIAAVRAAAPRPAGTVDGYGLYRSSGSPEVYFPDAAAADPKAMADFAARSVSTDPALEGMDERDCDLTRTAAEFDRLLAGMRRVARKVVVYIPPVTPLKLARVPRCFLDGVRAMVRARAGADVVVETGDWESYGLDYGDFAQTSTVNEFSSIDVSHVNAGGARKVARRIGGVILRKARLGHAEG